MNHYKPTCKKDVTIGPRSKSWLQMYRAGMANSNTVIEALRLNNINNGESVMAIMTSKDIEDTNGNNEETKISQFLL